MPYVIKTNDLTKTIGGKTLISNVNMHVKKGEIYGFLGPNGAGKTTVMKLLANLWKPTAGSVELFGESLDGNPYRLLGRMGSIIEFPVFYEHMTGAENLKLHCEYLGYYKSGCIEEALEMLDLKAAADKPVKSYSLGMKQRLGLARAVLTRPELLILDEPTNGLDPAGLKKIRELMELLCREYGITILVSTHILSEIESIVDTVGMIRQGQLLKEASMEEIREMGRAYIELSAPDARKAAYVLTEKLGLSYFKILDNEKIRIYDREAAAQEISKALALNDVEITGIGKVSESLEDYFLKMTGEVNQDV